MAGNGKFELRRMLGGPSQGSLCAKFSPDGMYVTVGGYDADVLVYSSNAGWEKPAVVLNSTMTEGRYMKSPVTSITFRPSMSFGSGKNVILVTASDGGVSHWHLGSAKQLHGFREEENQVLAADFSPNGASFVTAGSDACVRIYDEERHSLAMTLKDGPQLGYKAHSGRIQSLRWVNENIITTGGWDYTVQVWDTRQPLPVRTIFGPYLTGDGLDVSGSMLVTGSSRDEEPLELWDWTEGKKMHTIQWPDLAKTLGSPNPARSPQKKPSPHSPSSGDEDTLSPSTKQLASLMTAKFSHNGRYIAAGGHNDFRIFDLKANYGVVGQIAPEGTPHCVFHTAFSQDDKEVVVTGAGPEVYILKQSNY